MAGKRWLNIVVDGNIALQPYWHDIVSNYLENIIRSFRGNLLEEAYLGLVLYNANTELVEEGFDVQFINWTKDANKFIENLSCLTFKGNGANQCTMAEGLAEALVMFPKPSDIMPTIDYYNGERHCILVAAGDPIPKRMMLCLPMINRKGSLVGQRLKAREADFLDVLSQIFPLLKVSVSVITPNFLPIYRAIFNLGNDSLLSDVPSSKYSNGQLTAFMSKKFQYAHNALMQQKRLSATSVESMNTTPTIPRILAGNFKANNTSSLACEVSIGERIGQASRTESGSSQHLTFQDFVSQNEVSPTDIALASLGHPQTNEIDDIMLDIFVGTNTFPPNKRSKNKLTLEEDNLELEDFFDYIEKGEPSTSKTIPIEALKEVETELEQALKDGSNNNSNIELISSSSKGVYIPAYQVQTRTSSVVEECSTRLLQSVPSTDCIFNPNFSSENCSSAAVFPPQHPPGVEQEYSTRLFQENASSSTGLVPQQPPPSFEEQYSTRLFQNVDDPSSYATLEPQQNDPSVGEKDSTILHQDIRSKKSASNPMFISENPSSSSTPLVTQQHSPSVLNPILNFENPSSSAVFVPQQQHPCVGEKYSTRQLHGINSNQSVSNPMWSLENPSSSDDLLPHQHPLSVGEDFSARLLHGKTSANSMPNPMLISENSSNSNSVGLLPQQHISSVFTTEPQSLYHQHGLINNPPQISTSASYGEGIFSNTMGNSHLQFQPYSSQNQFPTRPMGNFPENQYQSNHLASFGALNTSTFGTFNHHRNFLHVPTIDDFRLNDHTWEGFLRGKIHTNCLFIIKTKAFRSPTTPPELTMNWTNKLEVINFIPEKAVNDTKNICNPIGYVLFQVVQLHNVDLYQYLKSSNMCGKVDLPFQSIIISPAENENYFLGTFFDRGVVFVEQH